MTSTEATIVVGYDRSAASRAAVDHAARRAGPSGQVIIVHAFQVPVDYMGAPYYEDMMATVTSRTQAAVRDLEDSCAALAGVRHESEVIAGPSADSILRVAEVRQADEIVLGSRGRGRLGSMLLGSVAQAVIHGAACPVLIIPERMVEQDAEPTEAAAAV